MAGPPMRRANRRGRSSGSGFALAGCANPSSRKRFQWVGRQNLQLSWGRRHKRRRDVTPVGESFRNSASVPYVGDPRFRGHAISGRGFSCFKPFRHHFRPFSAARGKGTPALPAATTRHRSSGQEESAGGVRKCDGARHSVRSLREIQEYHSSRPLCTVCSSRIDCVAPVQTDKRKPSC
jgi:hypothetical protein